MKDFTAALLIICFIGLTMLVGLMIGIQRMEREAVKRGYATYDNQNGATEVSKFKWNDELKK